ncbi:MAG: aspartyl/asparaginyl beta-hydroxylase domain-containing protein [Pseudohongiellaceae bacterium]
MSDTANLQYKLSQQAFNAENAGRLRSAADDYRRAVLLDKNNPTPYLYLGYVLKKMGDSEAAVQVYSLAADVSPRAVDAWRNPEISEDIRLRSHQADEMIRAQFTELHRNAIAEYHQHHPEAAVERIYAALWCTTHDQEFAFKDELQRPHLFYVPDLAPIAIFDSSLYPWCGALESAWEEIRQEYYQVAENPVISGVPYIEANTTGLGEPWGKLIGSTNWSSLHLYKDDKKDSLLVSLLPKTCTLLEPVPLLRTFGQAREVLFSILQGNQHIPAHYGLANTDMTVHLPLITSNQAGIKVTDHVHHWQEGEIFLFDDSYIHESWNDSSETRVNLLFGAWHPDLSIDEQNAVSLSFESRQAWNHSRTI